MGALLSAFGPGSATEGTAIAGRSCRNVHELPRLQPVELLKNLQTPFGRFGSRTRPLPCPLAPFGAALAFPLAFAFAFALASAMIFASWL